MDSRQSKRIFLRTYNVPVEELILVGNYSKSPVYKLPDHCLIRIFSYLPLIDRIRIQRVCKFWYDLSLQTWESYTTLTFSLKDWGHSLAFNSDDKFLVLNNVLKLCGRFITSIDYFSNSKGTVWATASGSVKTKIIIFAVIRCPNLTVLNLSHPYFTDYTVTELQQDFRKLRSNIMDNTYTNQNYLSTLFQKHKNLRKLVLHTLIPDSNCWRLLNPESIEEIDIILESVTDHFARALSSFVNIRSFRIINVKDRDTNSLYIDMVLLALSIVAKSFKKLAIVVYKRDLHLRDSPPCITLSPLHYHYLRSLETLEISGNELLLSGEVLQTISQYCTKLIRLCLKDLVGITDAEMMYVTEFPKLEELEIVSLIHVTDIIFINGLSSLKRLRCNRCDALSNFGLCVFIRTSKTIESIYIKNCENISIKEMIKEAESVADRTSPEITYENNLLD